MPNPVRERRPKKEGPSRVVHPPAPLADHERWVFGYGSNMDLVDLERWLREQGFPSMPPDEVRVGTLPGHRIVWDYYAFSRRGGAANCAPADGDLPGLLVRVSEPLLAALDLKEGETYFRAVHDVHTEQGAVRAWVYRVHDHYREPISTSSCGRPVATACPTGTSTGSSSRLSCTTTTELRAPSAPAGVDPLLREPAPHREPAEQQQRAHQPDLPTFVGADP